MRNWRLIISIVLLFMQSACVVMKNKELQSMVESSSCNQQDQYFYKEEDLPKPLYMLQLDTLLLRKMSTNSIHIANAIGALDLITEYLYKKENQLDSSIENRVSLLELEQNINKHIDFASIEISAIASEFDCEEERINQIVSYVKNLESTTESRLTMSAIIVGAAGAVAEGVLAAKKDKSDAADIIGLAGGITEATLGVLMLVNKRKIEFHHERNSLREIKEGKKISGTFPASVWYYLNYYNPNEETNLHCVNKFWTVGRVSGK